MVYERGTVCLWHQNNSTHPHTGTPKNTHTPHAYSLLVCVQYALYTCVTCKQTNREKGARQFTVNYRLTIEFICPTHSCCRLLLRLMLLVVKAITNRQVSLGGPLLRSWAFVLCGSAVSFKKQIPGQSHYKNKASSRPISI